MQVKEKNIAPYFITQRKIILAKSSAGCAGLHCSDIIDIIISYLVDFLLIKHKSETYFRSLKLCDIDSSMFYQLQKEINGLMGFSLLAKCDGAYNLCEIKSIGSYLSDFSIKHTTSTDNELIDNETTYDDFCLFDSTDMPSNSNGNVFIITKINGCMYDLVTGFDIMLLIFRSMYGLKFAKISKKRRDKLKTNGVKNINI